MNIFFDLLKTVCNPETPYNMYSVIETNYVSSGLLFIYFYYIRASSIAFFITLLSVGSFNVFIAVTDI